ncbi:MAG: hypothetical protein KDC57_22285 [Saprospiraceae bacterium]|nr:hypothetical protein [Saprospiraceae bacterium]
MRTLILSICLLGGLTVAAQNGLKFYTSFQFTNQDRTVSRFEQEDTIRTGTNKSTNIGGFIPAFSLGSANGSFLEFAITNFRFQNSNQIDLLPGASHPVPGSTTNTSFGVRVEYAYSLFEANGIRLLAGAAVNPAVSSKHQIPESSYFYDTRTSNFTVLLDIVPRIQVDLSESLFLDLNVPITLIDWASTSITYDSSIVPSAPIKQSGSTTLVLPQRVVIRLGLGIRF